MSEGICFCARIVALWHSRIYRVGFGAAAFAVAAGHEIQRQTFSAARENRECLDIGVTVAASVLCDRAPSRPARNATAPDLPNPKTDPSVSPASHKVVRGYSYRVIWLDQGSGG